VKWSTGAVGSTITGLTAGTYYATVTDDQGCFLVNYASVAQQVKITANTTVSQPTCLQNNGGAIAFGSGGMPPYSYNWSNGKQTQIDTGLTAGYYYVTVTDFNHCSGTAIATVSGSTPITVTYTTTPSSCTSPTGSATLNITGGTKPYKVAWGSFPVQTT